MMKKIFLTTCCLLLLTACQQGTGKDAPKYQSSTSETSIEQVQSQPKSNGRKEPQYTGQTF